MEVNQNWIIQMELFTRVSFVSLVDSGYSSLNLRNTRYHSSTVRVTKNLTVTVKSFCMRCCAKNYFPFAGFVRIEWKVELCQSYQFSETSIICSLSNI